MPIIPVGNLSCILISVRGLIILKNNKSNHDGNSKPEELIPNEME